MAVGATISPITTLSPKLPIFGSQSVIINLRSVNNNKTLSRTSNVPAGWTGKAKQATSISQSFVVQPSDIDPVDGKLHVRFIAIPVMENPPHAPYQQPFYAIQLNNITTGRTGANPLFFQWNYAGQPGVPWNILTAAGTNSGSNTSYQFLIFQEFDIAPGNAFIHVGDLIELVALASGCTQNGHEGHLYLDVAGTRIPSSLLWVTAAGPISASPGQNITYTYTYTNTGTTDVNNVQVLPNLPLQQTGSASTTFVSVTNPTTGGTCSGTGPVTCNIGTLQPGQTGTFQMTVNIPSSWPITSGPVNNGDYVITGDGLSPLLGPLVQTTLLAPTNLSNLVVNTVGLPFTASVGVPYMGSFSCSNIPSGAANGDAPGASCDITNLPAGLSVTGCTISPSNTPWTQPATIPANQTVTCSVSGTPTTPGNVTATVSSDASNNSNSTTNHANVTIYIPAPPPPVFSNLVVNTSGLPFTAGISSLYSGSFSCSNVSTASANGNAPAASCDIAGLPAGLSVTGCTISPSNTPWIEPAAIPANQTVTCFVSGTTPATPGNITATVTSNSSNNTNFTDNQANVTIYIPAPPAPTFSNLVVNTSGLPLTLDIGTPYSGVFTCSNISTSYATGDASAASCGIANLPSGLNVAGCTITPSNTAWTQTATIPSDQRVTCSVTGTPTTSGNVTTTVISNAANNTNFTENHANVFFSFAVHPLIPATLNGSPVLSPAIVCCGRPVILGPLPVPGPGETSYVVSSRTGNVNCFIGHSGNQTYVKVSGGYGSCTIIGTKSGITSAPFTIVLQ
ncbi:TPA: DUF11 domain-containing protein [Legionella pneumophila]|nr:DUF11 domain-containing protein [Legionella pneumophila]